MAKWMLLIAGPNGAGKSTFAQIFLDDIGLHNLVRLNADERTLELRKQFPDELQSSLNLKAAIAVDTAKGLKGYEIRQRRAVIDAYEKGKMKVSAPTEKEIAIIKATVKHTLVKNRRITIRLYDHDYQGIKKKAIELGIPCQTLISGIIHQYIEGGTYP